MYGYIPDIVKLIVEKQGHTLKVDYLPFARNLAMTRRGDINGILGMYKSSAPDFIYSDAPQGIGEAGYFVWHTTTWRYEGLESLKKINKVGVVRDYTYSEKFDRFIKENPEVTHTLSGGDPQQRIISMLRAGRINVYIEDSRSAEYNIMKMGLQGKVIKVGGFEKKNPVYVAWSPVHEKSQQYAKMVEDGIKDLRKSGELKTVLDKYGLSDWVK